MKIKLLEAMAYGTPVVTTSEGAEGLAVVDGRNAFVSDEDDAIAEKTIELLLNCELAERMSEAARALVESAYSPGPVAAKMEGIYRDLLSGDG
jgi:glycosyltransferase involved in cell wall biosynthesis